VVLEKDGRSVGPVKVEKNILQTLKRREVNWISHISLRKCLLNTLFKGRWREGYK
jgi:hypothetical protein